MSDNKLIDLHKVAGLFREIQTEEFAKEEAKQESEFKKTVKEMEQSVEDEISEELTAAQKKLPAGLRDAIAKKQGGSADDKDDKEKTEEEVEENINELNVPNDLEKVKAQMAKLKQMASDAQAKGDHNRAYNIERSSEMLALQKKLSKLGGDIDEEAVTEDDSDKALALKDWYQNWSKYEGMNGDPLPKGYIMSIVDSGITTDGIEAGEADKAIEVVYPGKGAQMKGDMNQGDAQAYNVDWGDYEIQKHLPITNAMKDDFISIMGNDDEETMQDAWEICSEIWNESVSEDSETGTLQQLLKLAGLKVVTDADINQVEEYSNSPDEEYADADTQLNKMSGGINRPKAMPAVGNQGHNDLVTKLKKAYDSRDL